MSSGFSNLLGDKSNRAWVTGSTALDDYNLSRADKFTDVTIPLDNTTFRLSGTSPQIAGPMAYDTLYILVSKNAFHAVASSSPTFSASTNHQYWPGDMPTYHIPKSGSTEYISIYNNDGSNVEAWLSITERTDN